MADHSGPAPTVLRAATRRTVPWKNGGGVTAEIASFPPGSGMDDFGWRISTALVEAAGPFSIFGGIERILTVLEGRLALRFAADHRLVVLDCGQCHHFPGDVAVEGFPVSGPVRDLNVMVRRGEWQAEVSTELPRLDGTETLIALATQPAGDLAALDAVQLDGTHRLPSDFVGYFICLRTAIER